MQITEAQPETAWTATEDRAWNGTIALVSALLSNTSTPLSGEDMQKRIRSTFSTLLSLRLPPADPQPDSPSVAALTRREIETSIGADAMISFENGRHYKTLRRHLHAHGMTPDQYREKWGLPSDYPTVHPSYSAARSRVAKETRLGCKGRVAPVTGSPSPQEPD